jgi:hypothetical protein
MRFSGWLGLVAALGTLANAARVGACTCAFEETDAFWPRDGA